MKTKKNIIRNDSPEMKMQLDEEDGECVCGFTDILVFKQSTTSEQVYGPDTGVQDKQLGWNSYFEDHQLMYDIGSGWGLSE